MAFMQRHQGDNKEGIMCEVLYTESEGGQWQLAVLDEWSEENLKLLCEAQKKGCVDSHHRVRLTGGYKAAAVLFHDGLIWDAILSGYDTRSRRGLPRSFPNAY